MKWFEKHRRFPGAALTAWLSLAVLALGGGALQGAPVADFTFIQVSDVHAPRAESQATIARIAGLGRLISRPSASRCPSRASRL